MGSARVFNSINIQVLRGQCKGAGRQAWSHPCDSTWSRGGLVAWRNYRLCPQSLTCWQRTSLPGYRKGTAVCADGNMNVGIYHVATDKALFMECWVFSSVVSSVISTWVAMSRVPSHSPFPYPYSMDNHGAIMTGSPSSDLLKSLQLNYSWQI